MLQHSCSPTARATVDTVRASITTPVVETEAAQHAPAHLVQKHCLRDWLPEAGCAAQVIRRDITQSAAATYLKTTALYHAYPQHPTASQSRLQFRRHRSGRRSPQRAPQIVPFTAFGPLNCYDRGVAVGWSLTAKTAFQPLKIRPKECDKHVRLHGTTRPEARRSNVRKYFVGIRPTPFFPILPPWKKGN